MFGNFVLLRRHRALHRRHSGSRFAFSTMARSQMQSMQMTMFFFLPNILLSASCFRSAHAVWRSGSRGATLTHFLRIVRGVMLKAPAGRHRAAVCRSCIHRLRRGGRDEAYKQTLD